jgi:hypothetical protein
MPDLRSSGRVPIGRYVRAGVTWRPAASIQVWVRRLSIANDVVLGHDHERASNMVCQLLAGASEE